MACLKTSLLSHLPCLNKVGPQFGLGLKGDSPPPPGPFPWIEAVFASDFYFILEAGI